MPTDSFHSMEAIENNFVYKSRLVDLGLIPISQKVSTFQYFLGIGLLAATVVCYFVLFCFCAYVIFKAVRTLLIVLKNRIRLETQRDTKELLPVTKSSYPYCATVVPTEFSLEEDKCVNSSFLVVPSAREHLLTETNIYCPNDRKNPAVAVILTSSSEDKDYNSHNQFESCQC